MSNQGFGIQKDFFRTKFKIKIKKFGKYLDTF